MRTWEEKFRTSLSELFGDKSGTVAILFALAVLPVLLSIGSAIDFGRAYHTRSAMQNAADAALLAAVLSGEDDDAMRQMAFAGFDASMNGNVAAQFSVPPVVDVIIEEDLITLTADARVKTTLMGIITESVAVGVLASVRFVEGGPACIMSLSSSAESAFNLSGTAQVSAKGCGIQVNSDHPQSITQNGSADADVPHICTNGGHTGSLSTKPRRCPPVSDPLRESVVAGIASEMPGGSERSWPRVDKHADSPTTISPGLYRGTLRIQAGERVFFEPGLYFVENGNLEVWANSAAYGEEVTFIFFGNMTGGVTIRSGSDVVLTATKTGPFAGLLFVQDPNGTPSDGESILIGGGNLELTGTIYMPLEELTITGNGSISADSPQFAIIADTISLQGNGSLHINMDTDFAEAGYDELPGVQSMPGVVLVK